MPDKEEGRCDEDQTAKRDFLSFLRYYARRPWLAGGKYAMYRDLRVIRYILSGKTRKWIADRYNITNRRINQILQHMNMRVFLPF
jgi:hypothetical protein